MLFTHSFLLCIAEVVITLAVETPELCVYLT
jgi:hypothetical protein